MPKDHQMPIDMVSWRQIVQSLRKAPEDIAMYMPPGFFDRLQAGTISDAMKGRALPIA